MASVSALIPEEEDEGSSVGGAVDMRTLALAMRFCEHARQEDAKDPEWSQGIFKSFARHYASMGADPGPPRTQAARDADLLVVRTYDAHFRSFSRLNASITLDLQALRESWVSTGPFAGERRFEIFDRCVASRAWRAAPPSPDLEGFRVYTCEFSGVASADTWVYYFGHRATDRVKPLKARLDRTCFALVVRRILAYAHFTAHMTQHRDFYPGYTDAQRLDIYAKELRDLRGAVLSLMRERPSRVEQRALGPG